MPSHLHLGDCRKMPKRHTIWKHWVALLVGTKYWLDAFYECESQAEQNQLSICFACGTEGTTERCHIVPKCEGGADTADNLHLLCPDCHLESEFLPQTSYWDWFNWKAPANSSSHFRKMQLAQFLSITAAAKTGHQTTLI